MVRTDRANKKIVDLKEAEETHDLGAIYQNVEKTFSAKGREFCLVDAAAEHLGARGKDNTTDIGDFADRIPSAPN